MTQTAEAANQYHSYHKGWTAGAASKAMDPVFTGHTNEKIRLAYEQGYQDARLALNKAMQKAADTYRYRPSILRLCDAATAEA